MLVKGIEGKAWNMRRAARVVYSKESMGKCFYTKRGSDALGTGRVERGEDTAMKMS